MKILKLFVISILITSNTLWAQNMPQQSLTENQKTESAACKPFSQEEIDEINNNIANILAENFAQKADLPSESEPAEPEIYDDWWATSIFTTNPGLRLSLVEKYEAYNEARYKDWKESPYGKMSAAEIDEITNNYFKSIRKSLKQNPVYRSNRIGQNCGELGFALTIAAVFEGLYALAAAAMPYAGTAEAYSTLSGFSTMKHLFQKKLIKEEILKLPPIFMARASERVKYIGGIIGSVFQFYGSSAIAESSLNIKDRFLGTFDESNSSLGAQADAHTALKRAITLADQIEEINKDSDLNPTQKRRRINTRYKEAIIKIYALDYIDSYLAYGEKPEKYLWAILDLTTILQNRGYVTFEGEYGRTINIEMKPRLIERTPEMQQSLEKIMRSIIYGFKILGYGRLLKNKVEKRAIENFNNSDIMLNYNLN